jgi:dihydrofolate reductase
MVSMIAAIGNGRVLGKNNGLLWRIPDDMKRLRRLTDGHVLIMGRKTFDSIISARGAPLPNRTNIIITREPAWRHEGVVVAHSIEEALEKAREFKDKEIFIFGGAQIYEQALPYADRLYMTLIDDQKEGDAHFPEYESIFTKITFHEDREHEGLKYKWVDLDR